MHTPTCDRLADFLDDKAGACAGAELAAENTEQAFVAQVEETMFRAAAAALRATPSEPSDEDVARELAERHNVDELTARFFVRAVNAARERARGGK